MLGSRIAWCYLPMHCPVLVTSACASARRCPVLTYNASCYQSGRGCNMGVVCCSQVFLSSFPLLDFRCSLPNLCMRLCGTPEAYPMRCEKLSKGTCRPPFLSTSDAIYRPDMTAHIRCTPT
eukprot:3200703-Rhodomonas_salina.1